MERALVLFLLGCSATVGGAATDTCNRYEEAMRAYASRCGYSFHSKVDCEHVDVFDVDVEACAADLATRPCVSGPAPASCKVSMW